jgi:hypothetical protein
MITVYSEEERGRLFKKNNQNDHLGNGLAISAFQRHIVNMKAQYLLWKDSTAFSLWKF